MTSTAAFVIGWIAGVMSIVVPASIATLLLSTRERQERRSWSRPLDITPAALRQATIIIPGTEREP